MINIIRLRDLARDGWPFYKRVFRRHIKSVWGVSLVSLFVAVTLMFLLPRKFVSQITLSPKSQAAAQSTLALGLLGQSNSVFIEKAVYIAQSRRLLGRVLSNEGMLQTLYPNLWDSTTERWTLEDTSKTPQVLSTLSAVKKGLHLKASYKNELIFIQFEWPDSLATRKLLTGIYNELDQSVQELSRLEAQSNRQYLEEQLIRVSDPILREKIQRLIALEIEKSMLSYNRVYDVLEGPTAPVPVFPGPFEIGLLVFLIGVLVSVLVPLLLHGAGWLMRSEPAAVR